MLEMAPSFLWLCSDHGAWSLFKLCVCSCMFYYVWTLIFEAHHTAPDYLAVRDFGSLRASSLGGQGKEEAGKREQVLMLQTQVHALFWSLECRPGWRCGLNALNACMEIKCAC